MEWGDFTFCYSFSTSINNYYKWYLFHSKFFLLVCFLIKEASSLLMGFPGSSLIMSLSASEEDTRNVDLILWSRRFPGVGNGSPLQYSCLEVPWIEESSPLSMLQSMGLQRVWNYTDALWVFHAVFDPHQFILICSVMQGPLLGILNWYFDKYSQFTFTPSSTTKPRKFRVLVKCSTNACHWLLLLWKWLLFMCFTETRVNMISLKSLASYVFVPPYYFL